MNEKGKFILNLLPSGILRENTVNIMGTGMVIDVEHLVKEIKTLQARGIIITPQNLKISDKAIICFPFHRTQDIAEEERLADKQYGSTKRGIAPVYADKYMKKGIRMGDLFHPQYLEERVKEVVVWKNLLLQDGYKKEPISSALMLTWVKQQAEFLLPYICDTSLVLHQAKEAGKSILFEAQLGALRDIDYGIYPYTSSSTTLAAYAPLGAGIPSANLNQVIGIMKAYSSCVGEGPFVVEMHGEEAKRLREEGQEYGAATGRPRRVGAFDVVASAYGVKLQGATELALTKLDVLAYMSTIPVCVAYEIDGQRVNEFITDERLQRAKPIFEYLPGFQQDIRFCRKIADLPKAAYNYIKYIEQAVGCPIRYVSVGPNREDYVEMESL
jgi:adenylosuccinate synthase